MYDMACAIQKKRPHRASAEMAAHVVDVMHTLIDSGEKKKEVNIESTCSRPLSLPPQMAEKIID